MPRPKKNNSETSLKDIWEKNPLSFILATVLTTIVLTSSLLIFYFNNRIEDIKFQYENSIKNIENNHKNEIEFEKYKAQQESKKSYYINIDENSAEGKEFEKFLNNISKK
jgi:hypothetical protein